MSQKREYPRVREQLVDTRNRRTDTLPVSTVRRYSMSRDRLTRKCERCGYAEHLRGGSGPALRQSCNKCNTKGHFASVCRSKPHKAYEVEREGPNHIVAKPKVTEEDRLSVTSKVTEPNHTLKQVNRLRSSV